MAAPARLLLASSNPGKLSEYRALAAGAVEVALIGSFHELPRFDERAPTFAENAAGKALHYSRFADWPVFADDSGLVVSALGGAPGVQSARYAGPGSNDAARVSKLLEELRGKSGSERQARFICVVALAAQGRILGVFSDSVAGEILEAPRGRGGFGYDPVFYFPPLKKTFAELSPDEKNRVSHRGGAFRKLFAFLQPANPARSPS